MRRLTLIVMVVALTMGVVVAPAGARGSGSEVGSWLAVDVEGSLWRMNVSASGHINSIDSGTIPCEGYRTHLWGELEAVDETSFMSLDLRCLAGPFKGTTFTGFRLDLSYDPGTDTLLQPNSDPFRDVVFCRRPCDPYDYVP